MYLPPWISPPPPSLPAHQVSFDLAGYPANNVAGCYSFNVCPARRLGLIGSHPYVKQNWLIFISHMRPIYRFDLPKCLAASKRSLVAAKNNLAFG